ncbi:MAG: hypothetical protein Q9205_000619 [Flavoplaca limonia]
MSPGVFSNSDGQADLLRPPHPPKTPHFPQIFTSCSTNSPSSKPQVVDSNQPATTDALHQASCAGESAALAHPKVIKHSLHFYQILIFAHWLNSKHQDYQTTNPSLQNTHQSSSNSSASTLRESAALSPSPGLQPGLDDSTQFRSSAAQSINSEAHSYQEHSEVPGTCTRSSESTTHGLGPDWVADSELQPEDPLSGWIAHYESDPEDPLSEWIITPESKFEDHLPPERTIDCKIQPEEIHETKMTVDAVRHLLSRNRMFVEDSEADERGKALIEKATGIMDDRRHSSIDSKTANKIVQTVKFFGTKNEKTLLVNLWQLLVNETRSFFQGEERVLSSAEAEEASLWIQKAWREDDNLWTKWDADFNQQAVPDISTTGDEALNTLLAGVPRVAKPVPDLCIGFDEKAFEDKVVEVLDKFGCTLTAAQYISFLLLEAKGADGTPGEATNQCCRGGAAMVKLCRDFIKSMNAWSSDSPKSTIGEANYPSPDMDSFAFSMALHPQMAVMYVHWAEVTGVDPKTQYETEVWQQSKLRAYLLDSPDHIQLVRQNIDNVQDWGIRTRKRKIEKLCTDFIELNHKMSTTQRASATKRAREALESPLIKRQKT